MKIEKGTKLIIEDRRKGIFLARASDDFDTNDEWYSVILDQDYLEGKSAIWERGDRVPARKGISLIKKRTKNNE